MLQTWTTAMSCTPVAKNDNCSTLDGPELAKSAITPSSILSIKLKIRQAALGSITAGGILQGGVHNLLHCIRQQPATERNLYAVVGGRLARVL
jgi:hypothetical protein